MTEHLLTVPQVAEILSVSTSTVWRMVLNGRLSSYKINRSRRVAEKDVQHLIDSTRQEGDQPVKPRGRKS